MKPILEIPLSSDAPHFSQEHQIFERNYVLEFEWIDREGYWAMHLYDASAKPIALGLRVMLGWPIHIERDTGLIFTLIANNPNTELNLQTFNKDFTLVAHALV